MKLSKIRCRSAPLFGGILSTDERGKLMLSSESPRLFASYRRAYSE